MNGNKKTEYLIIPQIRIKEGNISNNQIFDSKDKIEKIGINEPQMI